MVKNLPANIGNVGFIPGSGRSPEEGNSDHPNILACKIPWTEKPGGLQSMGLRRMGQDLATKPPATTTSLKLFFPPDGSQHLPFGEIVDSGHFQVVSLLLG